MDENVQNLEGSLEQNHCSKKERKGETGKAKKKKN